MIFHAQPRFTRDLDLLIKADPVNAQAAYDALADFGVMLEGIRPHRLHRSQQFFPLWTGSLWVRHSSQIPGIDFDAAWERRTETMVDPESELKAYFISRDDLIAAKLASGRPQDLADVDALRRAAESQRATPGEKPTEPK